MQEFYGVGSHPAVGRKRIPLRIELLSPAQRPVQVTTDLPASARKLAAGAEGDEERYPKHFWPDDPASADPMLRTVKPKKV